MRHCNCCRCVRERVFPKPDLTLRDIIDHMPVLDRTADQSAYLETYDLLDAFPDENRSIRKAIGDWFFESAAK